jgi:hypothetical protein
MAQTSVSIHVSSAPSVSLTFIPPAAAALVAPVPAGTLMGVIKTDPPAPIWSGNITMTGPNAGMFSIDTDLKVHNKVELDAGNFTFELTSNP